MLYGRALINRLSPKHRAQVRQQLAKAKPWPKPKPKAFGIEFDSKLELDFAAWLDSELVARRISAWKYHPEKFSLAPRLTYAPDFLVVPVLHSDQPTIYEVKGSWKMKNARDSRTRLKVAASLFPSFNWIAVTRGNNGVWKFETIGKIPSAIVSKDCT